VWIDAALHEEPVPDHQVNAANPSAHVKDGICGWMPYAGAGAYLGMWKRGNSGQGAWEPEFLVLVRRRASWPGEPRDQGRTSPNAASFWGRALMGLSRAPVYSFEPPGALWERSGKALRNGKRCSAAPLRIIEWGLYSHRIEDTTGQSESIRGKQGRHAVAESRAGRFLLYYKGTYGIDHPFQLILQRAATAGSCALAFSPKKKSCAVHALISASSFQTPTEVRAFFDPYYREKPWKRLDSEGRLHVGW